MIQGKDMLFSYVISVIENRDFYAEYHCEKVQRFTRILLEKVIRFCPDYKISEALAPQSELPLVSLSAL